MRPSSPWTGRKQRGRSHVPRCVTKRSLFTALGGLVVAGIAYNSILPRLSPPLDAVYAYASEHGYEREDLSVLEGGYSSELVSWSAYGRFRTPDDRELYVAVAKPSPFSGWRLSEVRLVR